MFSDRDISSQRDKVQQALEGADIFFGSLLFDFDQVRTALDCDQAHTVYTCYWVCVVRGGNGWPVGLLACKNNSINKQRLACCAWSAGAAAPMSPLQVTCVRWSGCARISSRTRF